ncbi:PREDICTED: SPARC-related modular calcium-binding protein 2-like, partial [Galeopterus variegatus]|uniref:SPARC-related modular calcium-binding protein 2-like n=1 Tax=Galeopterus variegatus TaxID=482537 RepID=A0ABM0RMB8_GALVR
MDRRPRPSFHLRPPPAPRAAPRRCEAGRARSWDDPAPTVQVSWRVAEAGRRAAGQTAIGQVDPGAHRGERSPDATVSAGLAQVARLHLQASALCSGGSARPPPDPRACLPPLGSSRDLHSRPLVSPPPPTVPPPFPTCFQDAFQFLRVDQDKDKDCSLDCAGSPQKPLCASDGRTFLSRCEFQRAKCKDPQLEVAYRGNCKDVSRCVAERKYTQEQARKEFQQVFIPECNEDGTYSQVQCHSFTGYCWCVAPNGRPISGTAVAHKTPRCPGSINEKLPQREGAGQTDDAVAPALETQPQGDEEDIASRYPTLWTEQVKSRQNKTNKNSVSSCDQEHQSALEEAKQPKNDNVVIPECAHGGLYKPVQCHPSTGYCWCVLVDTGRPIPGTSTSGGIRSQLRLIPAAAPAPELRLRNREVSLEDARVAPANKNLKLSKPELLKLALK